MKFSLTKTATLCLLFALCLLVLAGCARGQKNLPTAKPTPSSVVEIKPVRTPTPAPTAASTPTKAPTEAPTATPDASPTAAADPIAAKVQSMTERELIGQMVMFGFPGTTSVTADAKALMQKYKAGNIILFGAGWNTETFAQTKALVDKINAANATDIPLIVSLDVEGGEVTRFKGQWKPFISSAATLGKANDRARVYKQYTQMGKTLKSIGINLDLAPVADIAPNPSATFLGTRMFGSNPTKVSPLIAEAVKGLHNGGIASLTKHFPGHGDTAVDSHVSLPVIDSTMSDLEEYALVPFKAAIDAGVDAVLVAHISLPNVDAKYIASISQTIITGILREQLGFDGVVLSDDMRMAAIAKKYSPGEAAVRFIEAGGDIVLIGKYVDKQTDVFESLYAAYESGRLTRARLEESVIRVLKLKQEWCGLKL